MVNPNLDAIQETKIDLQDYDAEFGKAVAGVVTVQTKSGSNDFHGEGSGSVVPMPWRLVTPSPSTLLTRSQEDSYLLTSGNSSAAPSAARSSRTNCSSLAITRERANRTVLRIF